MGRPSPRTGATASRSGGPAGVASRRLAAEVVVRIDAEGAYANLALPAALAGSRLAERDRAFVTELVYGSTRLRRACDWAVDRFLHRDPDPEGRAHLRLGAYQILYLGTPPHAAVSATVDAAPPRLRGMVNAVLRRVADAGVPAHDAWPSEPVRLSCPDWLWDRLAADLGTDVARAALAAMNRPPPVTVRPDGYVQDLASTWVAEAVGLGPGERALDLCAAPGGKATALVGGAGGAFSEDAGPVAAAGAAAGPGDRGPAAPAPAVPPAEGPAEAGATIAGTVVAADRRRSRTRLLAGNVERLGLRDRVPVVAGDGTAPPFRPGSFDRILVDAPCSGLGALRRRPDARWRIEADDADRLAGLQRRLVDAVIPLLRPGGLLVYSVCTLTAAETAGIDEHLAQRHPDLEAVDLPDTRWHQRGRGGLVLPQDADTDGMYLLRLRAGSGPASR